jgi:hypothetical protein
MSVSFDGIRIFFDVEKKQIMFHNGDDHHFRVSYDHVLHQIRVKYWEDSVIVREDYTTTAPRGLGDNIEMWFPSSNITIDIEGTTGADYDRKKKEMFELMKQNNEERRKEKRKGDLK